MNRLGAVRLCVIVAVSSVLLAGCAAGPIPDYGSARRFTLGEVQKTIQTGMSQADLVQALGSPNMVVRDREGNECWVYDKRAVVVDDYSVDGGLAVAGGVIPFSQWAAYALGGVLDVNADWQGKQITERSITVVIRFDANALVERYSWTYTDF